MAKIADEKTITKKFSKAPLLEKIKEADLTKTAIFLGAGVDPDGLASQAVMAKIVELLGGKAVGYYRGTFNRPQNRTMKEILGLSPKPEEEFLKLTTAADGQITRGPYTCIISVDGPASTCPITPDFIIDHHAQTKGATIDSDIRLIGSSSAILWEYAIEAGIDFTTEDGAKLATAIALGIITDTRTGAEDASSPLDYDALAFCLKHKDTASYRSILNYPQPAYYNDLYVTGWNNKTIEGTVLVTGLGAISMQRSGAISDLAEKYASTDGINTAIVFAVVDGNIDISVRSSNSSLNVDDFVKSAFGEGGGKRGAGRAVVVLPELLRNLPESMNETVFEVARKSIVHKALHAANDGARAQS